MCIKDLEFVRCVTIGDIMFPVCVSCCHRDFSGFAVMNT